jgi:hypothetical protein
MLAQNFYFNLAQNFFDTIMHESEALGQVVILTRGLICTWLAGSLLSIVYGALQYRQTFRTR